MSVQEIESAITQLPSKEVAQLLSWLAEHHAQWNKQLEDDVEAGRQAGEQVEVIVLPHTLPASTSAAYSLRGTLVQYQEPLEPVAEQDWEIA